MSCEYCNRTIYTRETDYNNVEIIKHYNQENPNYCFECGKCLTESPEELARPG